MASSPQTGIAHQDLMTAAASQLLPLTTTYKFLAKIFFPSHALWQFSDTETWFHHHSKSRPDSSSSGVATTPTNPSTYIQIFLRKPKLFPSHTYPMVVMKLVVKVSSEKRRRRQLFPTPAKEEEEEEEAEIQVHFRLQRNALKKTLKIKAL
jgi:hypothetical protein